MVASPTKNASPPLFHHLVAGITLSPRDVLVEIPAPSLRDPQLLPYLGQLGRQFRKRHNQRGVHIGQLDNVLTLKRLAWEVEVEFDLLISEISAFSSAPRATTTTREGGKGGGVGGQETVSAKRGSGTCAYHLANQTPGSGHDHVYGIGLVTDFNMTILARASWNNFPATRETRYLIFVGGAVGAGVAHRFHGEGDHPG